MSPLKWNVHHRVPLLVSVTSGETGSTRWCIRVTNEVGKPEGSSKCLCLVYQRKTNSHVSILCHNIFELCYCFAWLTWNGRYYVVCLKKWETCCNKRRCSHFKRGRLVMWSMQSHSTYFNNRQDSIISFCVCFYLKVPPFVALYGVFGSPCQAVRGVLVYHMQPQRRSLTFFYFARALLYECRMQSRKLLTVLPTATIHTLCYYTYIFTLVYSELTSIDCCWFSDKADVSKKKWIDAGLCWFL